PHGWIAFALPHVSQATFGDGPRLQGTAAPQSRRLEGSGASVPGGLPLSLTHAPGNAFAPGSEPRGRKVYRGQPVAPISRGRNLTIHVWTPPANSARIDL